MPSYDSVTKRLSAAPQ